VHNARSENSHSVIGYRILRMGAQSWIDERRKEVINNMNWEYKKIEMDSTAHISVLNELGIDDWELVAVLSRDSHFDTLCYFKRPIAHTESMHYYRDGDNKIKGRIIWDDIRKRGDINE